MKFDSWISNIKYVKEDFSNNQEIQIEMGIAKSTDEMVTQVPRFWEPP